jgi:hypothetical protein
MEIKRFKLDNGREGLWGIMDSWVIELVFDNGDRAYLTNSDPPSRDTTIDTTTNSLSTLEPDYPLVSLPELPLIVERLRQGSGNPRYAVFMFIPRDSMDEEFVNLQYFIETGVLGLDWVLLGSRNIQDQDAVQVPASDFGYRFEPREENSVKYLRVEGEGLVKLGMKMFRDLYHLGPADQVQILAEGFQWPVRPLDCLDSPELSW